MFDPRAFWRDPDASDQAPEVRQICRPQYYLDLANVTELVVDTLSLLVSCDDTILELGSGTGRNLAGLIRMGYKRLYGIEINQAAIDAGRAEFPELEHVTLICSPIEDEIQGWQDVGCIFTQGVLMHLPPQSEWIFERIAKAARRVIVTIENETGTSDRAWPRNYKDIFDGLGWVEVESHSCEAWPPLPEETILRVFRRLT